MIDAFISQLFGFYNQLLTPILRLEPHLALGVFALTLSAVYSIIQWYIGDHEKISELQDKMEERRRNTGERSEEDNQQNLLSLQRELMFENFKPMAFIMIVGILFLPWIRATYAPNVNLNKTSNSSYVGELEFAGSQTAVHVDSTEATKVSIEDKETALRGELNALGVDWQVISFESSEEGGSLQLNADLIDLPVEIPVVGEAINWLGFYILLSIPFSRLFRKLLGIK